MSGLEHTLIALACLGIAYYAGNKIGSGNGYGNGYYDGMADSISAVMKSISEEYDLNLKADVEIKEINGEENE